MGLNVTSRIPAGVSGDKLVPFSETSIKSVEKRTTDQHIFDESIEIACDWLEATGRAITKQEFDNLFNADYSSYQASDVERVFYDWEDFQQVSESYYEKPEAKAAKQWELVESLHHKADTGLIPKEIFLKSESYTVKNPNEGKKDLQRQKLTGDYAASDIVLKRYHKYLLVNHLLMSKPLEKEVSEERKINIALGFSPSSEKQLSLFKSELKKSHSLITETDIHNAAEDLSISQYVFPEFRQEHLRSLVDAAQQPEYYYSTRIKKVLLIGRTALSSFSESEAKNHLERLQKNKKLLVGKHAMDVLSSGEIDGSIWKLGELLRNGLPKSNKNDRMRTMELKRDDFIEIASWIGKIVAPADDPRVKHLNEEVFMNAKKLGIGFSIHPNTRFHKEFGSMSQFYRVLGEARTHRKDFNNFDYEAAIKSVKTFGQQLGRRPTYSELIDAHSKDPSIPHPSTINRYFAGQTKVGVNLILEAAGLPDQRLRWDTADCLSWGLNYMRQTNRVPREIDIERLSKKNMCASRRTFKKNFGKFSEFKKQVRNLYTNESGRLEKLAA